MLEQALASIAAQQKDAPPHVNMLGEQLKDICCREPGVAELIAEDLKNPEQSLIALEKRIKKHADEHKQGGVSVVPPDAAEQIIRVFYGLAERAEAASAAQSTSTAQPVPVGLRPALSFLDLIAESGGETP